MYALMCLTTVLCSATTDTTTTTTTSELARAATPAPAAIATSMLDALVEMRREVMFNVCVG